MARIEGAPEDAEDALSCGRGIFGEGGASSGFTDIVSPSKLCKMAPPPKGGPFYNPLPVPTPRPPEELKFWETLHEIGRQRANRGRALLLLLPGGSEMKTSGPGALHRLRPFFSFTASTRTPGF